MPDQEPPLQRLQGYVLRDLRRTADRQLAPVYISFCERDEDGDVLEERVRIGEVEDGVFGLGIRDSDGNMQILTGDRLRDLLALLP